MRQIWGDQGFLNFTRMDPQQVEELKVLDQVIQKADRVLGLVAADLTTGIDLGTGRPGMSAEQVLRMAIVKQMNEWSYDDLYARVHDSILLRKFCRYEFELPPKPSTLQENIKKIRPETLEAVNRALLGYAKKEGVEDGKKIRIDSTPVETNIHYPTDSSLLWDGVRVLTRMLGSARCVFPRAGIAFHNRTRVMKTLAFAIANAKKEEERKSLYREMLPYAEEVLGYAHDGVKKLRELCGTDEAKKAARLTAREIAAVADLVRRVIDQTRRRVIRGETVPAEEKVVSLFEPDTNIIEKGGRETVFGHNAVLTVGKSSLVLDCQMELGNPADVEFFPEAIDRHKKIYGYAAKDVVADGGFASTKNARYAKESGVENISFSKRVGKAMLELLPTQAIHRMLMRFRAGIEGIISALKRAVGLGRCVWKGWESFQSYVWASIVAHNVKMLVRTMVERKRKCAATG